MIGFFDKLYQGMSNSNQEFIFERYLGKILKVK